MSSILLRTNVGYLMSVEALKYTGFLLMILDHLNRYLFSGASPWMDQAGRAAFPIFAMVLGYGLRRANAEKAVRQAVWLLAFAVVAHVAAMPLVAAEVRGDALNVLFTLGAGCLLVAAEACGGLRRWVCVSLALPMAWFAEFGLIGAFLVWSARRGLTWQTWVLLALLSFLQLSVVPLAAPALVWLSDRLCGDEAMRSPRMLFGAGYVAQFAVFSLLV